jgi:hypothetical protein
VEVFFVPTEIKDNRGFKHYFPGKPSWSDDHIYFTGDCVDGQGHLENVEFTDGIPTEEFPGGTPIDDPPDFDVLNGGWITIRDPIADINFIGTLVQDTGTIINVSPPPEPSWIGRKIFNEDLEGGGKYFNESGLNATISEIDSEALTVTITQGTATEDFIDAPLKIPGGVITPVFGNIAAGASGLQQNHIVRNTDFSGGNRRIYMLGLSQGDRESLICEWEPEVTDALHAWFYGLITYNLKITSAINTAPASGTVQTINVGITTGGSLDEFPESGQFPIKIHDEQMLVTGRPTSSTLTVVRGYAGTTTQTHANNSSLTVWPSPPVTTSSYFFGSLKTANNSGGATVIEEITPKPSTAWIGKKLQNKWFDSDFFTPSGATPFNAEVAITAIDVSDLSNYKVTVSGLAQEDTMEMAEFATRTFSVVFVGPLQVEGYSHPGSTESGIYPCNFAFKIGAGANEVRVFDPLNIDGTPSGLVYASNALLWGPQSSRIPSNDYDFQLNGSSIRQINDEASAAVNSKFTGNVVVGLRNNVVDVSPGPTSSINGLGITNQIALFTAKMTPGSSILSEVNIFKSFVGQNPTSFISTTWSSATVYTIDDYISYADPETGALFYYQCINDIGPTVTTPPNDSSYWQIVSRQLVKEDYKSWIGQYIRNDYLINKQPFKFQSGSAKIEDVDPVARTITMASAIPTDSTVEKPINFSNAYTFRLGKMPIGYTCDLTPGSRIIRNIKIEDQGLKDYYESHPQLDIDHILGTSPIPFVGSINTTFTKGGKWLRAFNYGQTVDSWVSGTIYTVNDIVSYDGAVYGCLNTFTNGSTVVPSSDTTNWELMPLNSAILAKATIIITATDFPMAFNVNGDAYDNLEPLGINIFTRNMDFQYTAIKGSSTLEYVFPKPQPSWVGKTLRNTPANFDGGSLVVQSIDVSDPLNYKITLQGAKPLKSKLKWNGIFTTSTATVQSLIVSNTFYNGGGYFNEGRNIILVNVESFFTTSPNINMQPFNTWPRRKSGTLTSLHVFIIKGYGANLNERAWTFNTKRVNILNGDLRGSQKTPFYTKKREPSHTIVVGSGTEDILFKDITGGGAYGDLIYFGAGLDLAYSLAEENTYIHFEPMRITFDNVNLNICGRQGYTWNGGIDCVYKNGSMTRVARKLVDSEPTTQEGRMLTLRFENCLFGHSELSNKQDSRRMPRTRLQVDATFEAGKKTVKLDNATPWQNPIAPKNSKGFSFINLGGEVFVSGDRTNKASLSNISATSGMPLYWNLAYYEQTEPVPTFLSVPATSGALGGGQYTYPNTLQLYLGKHDNTITTSVSLLSGTSDITYQATTTNTPHNGSNITLTNTTATVNIPKEYLQYLIDLGLLVAGDIISMTLTSFITATNTTVTEQEVTASANFLVPSLTAGELMANQTVIFNIPDTTWTPVLSNTAVSFSVVPGSTKAGNIIKFSLSHLYDKTVLDDFTFINKIWDSKTAVLNKPAKKSGKYKIYIMPAAVRRNLEFYDCQSNRWTKGRGMIETWNGTDEDDNIIPTSGIKFVRNLDGPDQLALSSGRSLYQLSQRNEDVEVTDNEIEFVNLERSGAGKAFFLGYEAQAVSLPFTGDIYSLDTFTINNVVPTPDSSWIGKRVASLSGGSMFNTPIVKSISGNTITLRGRSNSNLTAIGTYDFKVLLVGTDVIYSWKNSLGSQLASIDRNAWSPRTPWVVLRNNFSGALDDQETSKASSLVFSQIDDINPPVGQEINISGTVTFDPSNPPPLPIPILLGSVDIFDRNELLTSIELPSDGSGTYSFDIDTLTEGVHSIHVNYSGNVTYASSESTTRYVVVGDAVRSYYGNSDRVAAWTSGEITYSEMFLAEDIGLDPMGWYDTFNIGGEPYIP